MTLETERLLLRPISIADNDYVLAQLNDPGWLKNIGDRKVKTLEAATAYIENKILAALEKDPRCAFFVAIRKEDPKQIIIGQCGVFKRDGLEDPDLGFAFLEAYCGLGYGYESSSAVLEYALETMNLNKIVAITSDENIASQKLLNKLGLQYTKDITLPKIEGNNRYFEML